VKPEAIVFPKCGGCRAYLQARPIDSGGIMKSRGSGVLLHITSLPSPHGIGDLGPSAYQFADFLVRTGQRYWQILPLTPIHPVGGNSPYFGRSAFAGNPLLISPELLARDGLLADEDISSPPVSSDSYVDFPAVTSYKEKLFDRAFDRFRKKNPGRDYQDFCSRNVFWLEDYCRFVAIHSHFKGKAWGNWPPEVRDRGPEALKALDRELAPLREREKFLQYTFSKQWSALKDYCNQRDVRIIGDLPIYVNYDSADLWVHPEIFKLDADKKPYVVSGVPPDYFSETGQLWGNPIYRWEALRHTGFDWWIRRMEQNGRLCDLLRIDHFIGLESYWEIPAEEKTAVNGKWVSAPGEEFLKTFYQKFPLFPLIAEDLGSVTPAVRKLMEKFGLPGMKVLLFAFSGDSANPYLPHNHIPHCILYTGTHDNNTVRGWFDGEASAENKKNLFRYLGRKISAQEAADEFIRMAMMSVAETVILPIQDLLGLGAECRMNTPSLTEGNWKWRLLPGQITPELSDRLRNLTEIYGRAREEEVP
jgi:4-alpha-glucanotransferase